MIPFLQVSRRAKIRRASSKGGSFAKYISESKSASKKQGSSGYSGHLPIFLDHIFTTALDTMHSRVPNTRVGPNKPLGRKIFTKTINV